MLRPSQESFEELAKRGNWVPVVREILADMDTPLSLFRRLDDGRWVETDPVLKDPADIYDRGSKR